MAILVVDDEPNTRDVLRELLTEIGHKVMLEAGNGQEALSVLEREHTRIEMIVADWEMPHMDGLSFLTEIAEKPELDLSPFLLITSDLPKSKLEEFRSEHPRLDHFLLKPFRKAALADAMREAYEKRRRSRDLALFVGSSVPEQLHKNLKASDSMWKNMEQIFSGRDLKIAVEKSARRLGALFVSPEACESIPHDWLSAFKKSKVGGETPIFCLSRDPAKIQPLRTQAQFFLDEAISEDGLKKHLSATTRHLTARWKTQPWIREAKAELQSKEFKNARKLLRQVVAEDTMDVESWNLLGTAQAHLDEHEAAAESFRRCLEINPCAPQGYLKLLGLKQGVSEIERSECAAKAVLFCPHNTDVVETARRISGK